MTSSFYSKIEDEVKKSIESSNLSPACKLGCTHCCEDVSLFVFPDEINEIIFFINKFDVLPIFQTSSPKDYAAV